MLEVNRLAATDVARFKDAYSHAKDRALLRVVRQGRSLYVVVRH